MPGKETNKIRITENDNDVTVLNQGGRDGTHETVVDLEPPTDVEYHIHNGLKFLLWLRDSNGNPIEDNAEIILVGQDAIEEDATRLGRAYRYGEFEQANQRDEDEVVSLDLEQRYQFPEASHFKIQIDSQTAVDWSQSRFELETIRLS